MFKYQYLFLMLVLSSGNLLCQTLTGTVFDENRKPLQGAYVYLDGTTIAAMTDRDGAFRLSTGDIINTSLIVSFIGYNNKVIGNPFGKSDYQIYLKPKIYTLNEVVVRPGRFSRKEMLRIFREQFLGTTPAGKSCKILNEDDLLLNYDYKNNTLHASADKPVMIDNLYLGYLIFYNLADFNIIFNGTKITAGYVNRNFYRGTAFFKDLEKQGNIKIMRRRLLSYTGSPMHFFRNLYVETINARNPNSLSFSPVEFIIYRNRRAYNNDIPIIRKDYFTESDTLGTIKYTILKSDPSVNADTSKVKKDPFSSTFFVTYKGIENTYLAFRTRNFYVDMYGCFSPIDSIEFRGAMAEKRVGDLLPFDYVRGR